MEIKQAYRLPHKNNPIIITEEFNRPVGSAWRKYGRYWTLYLEDIADNNTGNIISDEELENEGLREQSTITQNTLHLFFKGKIKDWNFLLKVLEAFSFASFEYEVSNAFSYKLQDNNTVILKLGIIPQDIEENAEDFHDFFLSKE